MLVFRQEYWENQEIMIDPASNFSSFRSQNIHSSERLLWPCHQTNLPSPKLLPIMLLCFSHLSALKSNWNYLLCVFLFIVSLFFPSPPWELTCVSAVSPWPRTWLSPARYLIHIRWMNECMNENAEIWMHEWKCWNVPDTPRENNILCTLNTKVAWMKSYLLLTFNPAQCKRTTVP